MSTATPKNNIRSTLKERRALVLTTALELFTREGYFNTSVHDIQRRANVSIGFIYHHFSNKEGIAKALYDDLVEKLAGEMERIGQRHDTAHDRCRAVIVHLFDLTESDPEIMHYMLYANHREFMPHEKPVCSSRPFEMMKQMVADGIAGGEIRAIDPLVAATSIFGGAIRLISLRLDGVLQEALPRCLAETWQCAWRAVKKYRRTGRTCSPVHDKRANDPRR